MGKASREKRRQREAQQADQASKARLVVQAAQAERRAVDIEREARLAQNVPADDPRRKAMAADIVNVAAQAKPSASKIVVWDEVAEVSEEAWRALGREQFDAGRDRQQPTGHITWSGGGAATERMAYWLPPGIEPADIGLPSSEVMP